MGERKSVLVTGEVAFADGLEPQFLREVTEGGRATKLFEFSGLLITVTGGGKESQHRGVVSEERRFGFRVAIDPTVAVLDKVVLAKEDYVPVILERCAITGEMVSLGKIVLQRV